MIGYEDVLCVEFPSNVLGSDIPDNDGYNFQHCFI